MVSCLSALRDDPAATLNTGEKLLADFQRDSHPNKVCLVGKGEWRNRAREAAFTLGATVQHPKMYLGLK